MIIYSENERREHLMPAKLIFFQFIGFLIQTLPVAVLSLIPFHNDALPFSRKKMTLLFSGYTVLLSAGFALMSWLIYVPDMENAAFVETATNVYMTICIILSICIFFFTIRSPFMKKFIVMVLLIHYAAALFTLSNIVGGMLRDILKVGAALPIAYDANEYMLTTIILSAATFPFIYLFLKREVQFDLSYMENGTLRRGCVYMSVSLLLFAVCIFTLDSYYINVRFSQKSILLFLAAFMLTDCILYFMFFSEVHLTMKIRQSEEQLRSFDSRYRQISAAISEARRARHDIRYHLNHISAMNQRGEQKALEAYLQSYEASFHELEQIPLCGYPAFDDILQYYIECAGEKGIIVKTELRPLRESLGFDVIDVTVMLGNLMENAIEACCKLPSDVPRFIRIWVKQADAVFLLEVENSCEISLEDQPDFTDASHFSSTKHAVSHGIGLKSIQLAAEKYGGNAEFKKSNGTFAARVVLNIP